MTPSARRAPLAKFYLLEATGSESYLGVRVAVRDRVRSRYPRRAVLLAAYPGLLCGQPLRHFPLLALPPLVSLQSNVARVRLIGPPRSSEIAPRAIIGFPNARAGANRIVTHLRRETLNENGDQQIEEHVIAEGHQRYEIERRPVRRLLHAVEENDVPVLLREDLRRQRREGGNPPLHKTPPWTRVARFRFRQDTRSARRSSS